MAGKGPGDLSSLIECVYDVALSEAGWAPLLERATDLFGGTATVFFVQDRVDSNLSFARLWGLPPAAMMQYESRFAGLDVGLQWLEQQTAGSVITDESLPLADYRRSEFLNDFRRPWGIERFVAGEVFRDPRRRGVFAIQASHPRVFTGRDVEGVRRLLPHLRKATQLAAHVGRLSGERASLEAVVERLPTGLLLLDERGAVVYANASARRIDAARDGLSIREGRPHAQDASAQRQLAAAIAEALDLAAGACEHGGAFPVPRPSGAIAYSVLVTPGPGRASLSPQRNASVLVLIGDVESQIRATADLIARLYDLTPAEARLARGLASGESVGSYSERNDIAESTARTLFKRIQLKTGVRRQQELVRLLWTGPASAVDERADDDAQP